MKESFLSFSSILLINPLKYSILSIILSKRFSFWRFIYPVIKNSLEYSMNISVQIFLLTLYSNNPLDLRSQENLPL